jgi:hypothetical protein
MNTEEEHDTVLSWVFVFSLYIDTRVSELYSES